MKLINPRGKKVEVENSRANKILKNPLKLKQGWKKFIKPRAKKKDK